ncbi:MAG: HDIG domain-containing protein [Leptospiraceae bacterium]|nr:HDIG domain-containing protein [Leptospiraceae bacterium]MCP5511660.1 HDIG domain-containing protein [Leptospiraceae bacterium]
MYKLLKFLETQMALFTDLLTKVRPPGFIIRFQLLLISFTMILVTIFVSFPYFGQAKIDLSPEGGYAVGSVSPETITSPRELVYEDPQKTQIERAKAYNSGFFIFDRDYSILSNTINSYIEEEIDNLKSVQVDTSSKNISLLLSKNPRWKYRSRDDLEFLIKYPAKDKLKDLIQQCTNLIFTSSCILKEPPEIIANIKAYGGKVYNRGVKDKYSVLDGAHIIPRENLYKDRATRDLITKLIEEKYPKLDPKLQEVIKRLSLSYVYSFPACNYNSEETEQEKMTLHDKVKPIKSKIEKNEKLVRKGELITPEILYKLAQLNQQASRTNITSILSILIVQIVIVTIMMVFLKKYDPRKLNDIAANIIVFSLIWVVVIGGFIITRYYFHPDTNYDTIYYFGLFLPIGLVALLIGFIFDEQLSIAVCSYLSFYIFLIAFFNVTTFIISFSTAVVASIHGSTIRKRIDFIKSGFIIAGIQIIITTSGYLLDNRDFWVTTSSGSFWKDFPQSNMFKVYSAALINGFACATAAQFLLPIYEYLFNIPTRFKLQELSDTGHPLLQALLTKAPSTYTHTFMVAALSERAAQRLKLNWLLVRAGVYFHDIGKIPNAGFFVENQHLIPKKEHIDKNNPGMAARIVIDHVIDGIEMAKKARLPREVISFIPEHHGTSTMAFFYHKALADLSPRQRQKINKKDFQYPGPKPQSKETAIVMIADSVEAASRSLDVVSPESLDELVQKIINIKLAEDQLDESGLTIGDLRVIKESFKEILLSSLHQRPKYPSTEDTKKLEKETKKK